MLTDEYDTDKHLEDVEDEDEEEGCQQSITYEENVYHHNQAVRTILIA